MDAYLDIETTGLYPDSCDITVVGIYVEDGHNARFIHLVGDDITPESLILALEKVDVIYTYNGSRFDLPFIRSKLGIDLGQFYKHRDLMFDCHSVNLYGGLKQVERDLCIPRQTSGIDGYAAVQLWWRYVNDYDMEALDMLLQYNHEDVINLKVLKDKLSDIEAYM